MPSFGDIMNAVDMLQVKPVVLDKSLCVRATNRNSKCDKCGKACIADVFMFSRGEIELDFGACLNCGCCVPVCPTSALSMVEPSASQVFRRVVKNADPKSRSAMFACSRIASKNIADPDRFAEVPCLGHVGELQLIDLIAAGFDDVMLVDGDCSTCKLGEASTRIDDVVETASRMLDACESPAIITRMSNFPEEYLASSINSRGEGRRGLLRQTTSYMKTVAGNVAKKTLEEKLGEAGAGNEDPKTNGLKMGKGVMNVTPKENYRLIEDMETLFGKEEERKAAKAIYDSDAPFAPEAGESMKSMSLHEDVLRTRHFGKVSIDPERCSGCGMCVMFCPTKALKYDDFDVPDNEDYRYCDFQASDCVQCMLCKDVCLRECLEVDDGVRMGELFDLEPELVEMAKAKKTTSLAGLARRNHRDGQRR